MRRPPHPFVPPFTSSVRSSRLVPSSLSSTVSNPNFKLCPTQRRLPVNETAYPACPGMAAPRGIQRLSNELLRDILDHIEADPEKLVSLDRRAYLSQESFRPPPPPQPDQAQDIGHFRLTCKRFSELGAVHQFARVTTRFSRKGLKRLDHIASQPHLTRHVKKFSYMVPYFYVEGLVPTRLLKPRAALDPTSDSNFRPRKSTRTPSVDT